MTLHFGEGDAVTWPRGLERRREVVRVVLDEVGGEDAPGLRAGRGGFRLQDPDRQLGPRCSVPR